MYVKYVAVICGVPIINLPSLLVSL